MKLTKYIIATIGLVSAMTLSGCTDWLKEESPGSTNLKDFITGGGPAIQVINGCYAPLAWEYNRSYYSEWFFGDIASDDALKGGQNLADGADAYDIDNFKTTSSNAIVLDYYRAKYDGIARCNLALKQIPQVEPDDVMSRERRDCLVGEAYFLRALYYFQLVRVFGGVPLVDFVVDSSDRWKQERASADEVYAHIISDLKNAENLLWEKSQYSPVDLGRATKGAAQALLCKVNLYRGDTQQAYEWGKKFIDSQYRTGKYSLCQRYFDNFTLAGENGPESIFEIQYMAEGTSDYGDGAIGGNGFTRGTFTTILVRPRTILNAGWGWNHPTRNLYEEFEPNDPRREYTIGIPTDKYIGNTEINYLGNPYYNYKYAYMETPEKGIALDHDARSPLNYKLIRTSDLLLLFAEAAVEQGHNDEAKWALEEVRSRARSNATEPDALPPFPNYLGFTDNRESLIQAIRHERRVELAMEGHRWFDLVRWGIAYDVLNVKTGTYASHESEEVKAEMANFIKGKHELFPIPMEEIQLNPMTQNFGY